MERILFGDNQFFGVNHMSEEKARSQAIQFKDTPSIMKVLDCAYDSGIKVFMCTTHDRIGEIAGIVRDNPSRYSDFSFYPCMPYAHKYANAVGEIGIMETLRRYAPGGILETLFTGAISGLTQDLDKLVCMLIETEMKPFIDVKTPVVFLQNIVTDLLLGMGMDSLFGVFAEHVSKKYGAEPGFITMNLPMLVTKLEKQGIANPIVCANINKIGFRMSGGVDAYREVIASGRCRPVAMSVFASGAVPPNEAIEWVCGLDGLRSIVFGASSASNIRQSKELIERAWGIEGAKA
jgi:hypothetical protein